MSEGQEEYVNEVSEAQIAVTGAKSNLFPGPVHRAGERC